MSISAFRCSQAGLLFVIGLGFSAPSAATTICRPELPCEFVLNQNKTAFVGKVLSSRVVERDDAFLTVTDFATSEVFGTSVGPLVGVVTSQAFTIDGARRAQLTAGATYLMRAVRHDGDWHQAGCSSPMLLADAVDELRAFRAAKQFDGQTVLSGSVSRTTWQEGALQRAQDIVVSARARTEDGHESGEIHQTVTDDAGDFRFVGLASGRYVITALLEPPLKKTYEIEEVVTLEGCSNEATLFITEASFEGTVRAADGTPVSDSPVRVIAIDDSPERVRYRRAAFTDKSGHWSVDGVPDGQYLVSFMAFDPPTGTTPYAPVWYPGVREKEHASIVTLEGDRPLRLDFTLPPPLPTGTITGVVVDEAGRPLAHAYVHADDVQFPGLALASKTDERGRFTARVLVGRHLEVKADWYSGTNFAKTSVIHVILTEREDGLPPTREIELRVPR